MQQRQAGSADGTGNMPDPFRQPTEYLLAFLHRVALLDKEGFFQRPVREEEAPNYYSIIKQPMCFADMREKINSGAYQTWRQLRDDFNLIHENARRFNSNKTLVHRAALNLQKNGTKLLATYELEVRKALAVLHPLGAQQPGGPGGQVVPASTTAPDSRLDPISSPTAPMAAAAMLQQNGDVLGADGYYRPSGSGPPSPEAAEAFKLDPGPGLLPPSGLAHAPSIAAQLPSQPFLSILLPAIPRDPLIGYISDEEDQPVLMVGTEAAAVSVAAAASKTQPGLAPTHAWPLDALVALLRTVASRAPYAQQPKASKGQPGQREAAAPPGVLGAQTPPPADGSSHQRHLSREWKRARRPAELQACWLELRMRELQSQQDRLRSQISWMQQRTEFRGGEGEAGPGVLAAGTSAPAVAVLAAAAMRGPAPCTLEREGFDAAVSGFLQEGRVSASPYFRMRGGVAGTAAETEGGVLASTSSDPATAAAGRSSARDASDGGVAQPSTSGAACAKAGPPHHLMDPRREMPPPPASQHRPPQQQQQQQHGQFSGLPTLAQLQPHCPGRSGVLPPPTLLSPHQQQPFDEAEADKMLPGAVHASLELLEQRLSYVRARLQDAYKFDPNRLAVGRTAGPYGARVPSYQNAAGASQAPTPAGAPGLLPTSSQGGQVKRQSSGHGRRPGSLTVLTRFDSMGMPCGKNSSAAGGGKRKRSEVELLTGDIGTPLASYGRTSLDRSVSMGAIVIPPVRELPPDEFRARVVAATTWSQHYHTIGPTALDSVPPEVQAVLRKRRRRGYGPAAGTEEYDEEAMLVAAAAGGGGGVGRGPVGTSDDEGFQGMGICSDSGVGDDEGSSSSSEDTSDEVYAARHRLMEEEEHRRYAAVMAEGQRRRNKGSGSNAPASQQQQQHGGGGVSSGSGPGGAASQAKDRAKFGNKTPRTNNSFKGKEALYFIPPEQQQPPPPDGLELLPPLLPSAMMGYYQPYQPPMVGVTAGMPQPPTPGATTTAAVLIHPQPVVVQQVAAQRTASPPALLQVSPAGALGSQQHAQLQRQASVLTAGAASPSGAAGGPGPAPGVLPSMAVTERHANPPATAPAPAALQQQPTQAALAAEQQAASAQAAPRQPPAAAAGEADAMRRAQEAQQQGSGAAGQQHHEAQGPESQNLQPAGAPQSQWQGSHQASQQQESQLPQQQLQPQQAAQPSAPSAQPQQPSPPPPQVQLPEPAQPSEAALQTVQPEPAAGGAAAAAAASAAPAMALATPNAAAAAAQVNAPASPIAATAAAAPPPQPTSAAERCGAASGDTAPMAPVLNLDLSVPRIAPVLVLDREQQGSDPSSGLQSGQQAVEPSLASAAAGAANPLSGIVPLVAVASGASSAPTATAVLIPALPAGAAGSGVGGHSGSTTVAAGPGQATLIAGPAAAVLAAQSPAMSMQFLAGVPGYVNAGSGGGGPSNALTAAATSILLAAAAAAQAGGQSAAASLMGGARQQVLQQLAAGAPAAQVLANAAAAASAGQSGALAAGAGGQGQGQGKAPPPLFTAASNRGLTGHTSGPAAFAAAAAAAAAAGGGMGGISGLPAGFQALQGFPQSLAGVTGFNAGLVGGGFGAQQAAQWLSADGRGGIAAAIHAQQQQQQQQQQQNGMPAPLPAQRQSQGGTAEGRAQGRGRRPGRVVVEDDDEDWEEDEDEEEEAASTRRRSGRPQRRASNGARAVGFDGHGNGNAEGATRQSRRRAGKGTQNWAVLLASDSSDEEEDEEWSGGGATRAGRREGSGRGRGRGRRSAG